jgi:hypothetical protein
VLSPAVTRDNFQDFAIIQGWQLLRVVDQTQDTPYEEIWRAADNTFVVHYIEDDMLDVAYARSMGQNAGRATQIIEEQLPTITIEAATEIVRSAADSAERERGVAALAAAAEPEREDGQIRDAFRHALFDPDADVRRTTLFACAYVSWPSLDDALSQVRNTDPDPDVRHDAMRTIMAIARHRP